MHRPDTYFPQSRLAEEWRNLPRELHRSILLVMLLLYPETIPDIFWEFVVYQILYPPQIEVANERLERPEEKDNAL